ncbi:hypothetical protein KI387_028678, partial [Taxus chinensis]
MLQPIIRKYVSSMIMIPMKDTLMEATVEVKYIMEDSDAEVMTIEVLNLQEEHVIIAGLLVNI